jgi:hypothetical protein
LSTRKTFESENVAETESGFAYGLRSSVLKTCFLERIDQKVRGYQELLSAGYPAESKEKY